MAGAGPPAGQSTADHSMTAMIIRQNASTDPGTSAHLMIVELLEKASTATATATTPIGATAPADLAARS